MNYLNLFIRIVGLFSFLLFLHAHFSDGSISDQLFFATTTIIFTIYTEKSE